MEFYYLQSKGYYNLISSDLEKDRKPSTTSLVGFYFSASHHIFLQLHEWCHVLAKTRGLLHNLPSFTYWMLVVMFVVIVCIVVMAVVAVVAVVGYAQINSHKYMYVSG